MNIYPSLSAIRRALVVLLVLSAFSGAAFAQQAAAGPSLEETIAYINAHSSRTHGTVSVSLDSNLLVVQETFPNYCGRGCDATNYVTIPFRVISQVTVGTALGPDGTGDVRLLSRDECMHKHSLMPRNHDKDSRDKHEDTGVAIAAFVDDADQAERLNHALTRLLALLDDRYKRTVEQRDPNDPFK